MKNVNALQLKKCIFLEYDYFVEIMTSILGENTIVNVDYDGVSISLCNKNSGDDYDEKDVSEIDVIKELSTYFDVCVTSYHIDNYSPIGVWVVYKE